jgi:hypothetical protein
MNQYSITEEMLQTWRKGCVNLSNPHTDDDICKNCEYRGKGAREKCCDFDDNSMERIFRSRPYQSERDKVLKEVIKIINWCYDEGFPEEDPTVQKLMMLQNYIRQQAGE